MDVEISVEPNRGTKWSSSPHTRCEDPWPQLVTCKPSLAGSHLSACGHPRTKLDPTFLHFSNQLALHTGRRGFHHFTRLTA